MWGTCNSEKEFCSSNALSLKGIFQSIQCLFNGLSTCIPYRQEITLTVKSSAICQSRILMCKLAHQCIYLPFKFNQINSWMIKTIEIYELQQFLIFIILSPNSQFGLQYWKWTFAWWGHLTKMDLSQTSKILYCFSKTSVSLQWHPCKIHVLIWIITKTELWQFS